MTIANVVYVVNGCISYAKAISLFLTRSIIESSISGRATNGAVCARKEGTVQQKKTLGKLKGEDDSFFFDDLSFSVVRSHKVDEGYLRAQQQKEEQKKKREEQKKATSGFGTPQGFQVYAIKGRRRKKGGKAHSYCSVRRSMGREQVFWIKFNRCDRIWDDD